MAKILVLDDEIQIRELLNKALGMEGHDVITVPTPDQAMDTIFREPFDLVLLDIVLGGESGITVLKKIKEHSQTIPVVIYSGSVTAELEKEARTLGADDVLRKDIGIVALVERIGKIIKAKDRILRDSPKAEEKTILIVDDEKEIRNVSKNFFKMKGYKVLEAENGEEALKLVQSENVSVVLLDINMPEMDGLTTLEKLLKINPKLGVVMATGNQEDEKVKKAIELGAYGYILKPFDLLYLDLVVMSKLVIAESD